MENAQKALAIAAGVLLALMILAVVFFMVQQVAQRNKTLEEIQETEQRDAFNAEYTAYQKSLMYGTDVISCVNKALNNNEKYKDLNIAKLDVSVEIIDKPLTESVTVYHANIRGGTDAYAMGRGPRTPGGSNITVYDPQKGRQIDVITRDYDGTVNGRTYPVGEYSVNSATNKFDLNELMNDATYLQYRIENTGDDRKDVDSWSYLTVKTILTDFKTRMFKCQELRYSEETGRVNYIKFLEVKKPQ